MKAKKHPLRIFPLLYLILCGVILCGCAENEMSIVLNAEGGGEMIYTMRASKAAVDSLLDGRTMPEDLTVETVNGEECYTKTVHHVCATDEELEQVLRSVSLYDTGGSLFQEVKIEPQRIHMVTTPSPLSNAMHDLGSTEGVDLYDYMTMEISVTTPSRVETYQGGQLSEDGRSVTVVIHDLREAHTLTVTYAKVTSPAPIVLSVLGGATITAGLIMGVVAILRHRQRKRAEAMPDVPVDSVGI